jgi:hypothetical protein
VSVAQPGLGTPDPAASPQVIPGAPVRIECAGVPRDSDWAQTWFAAGGPLLPASTGIAKWSSNLHIVDVELAHAKPIGSPRAAQSIVNAKTHYCGVIGNGFLERQLEAIPTIVSERIEDYLPPVRGGVQAWRAFFFDDPTNSPPALERQSALLQFAAARLGGTVESDPEHKDELLILLSAADPNRHLVAGFNWPTPIVLRRADRGVRVNLGTYSKPRGAAEVKQLPFVDQDIRWIVRLSWNVPLESGSLDRPRDLMFVKEFRIYREELGFGAASLSPSKTIEDITKRSTLAGTLERPGADVFATKPNASRVNLDEVEWLWIDAISDSNPHRYVYHVVAVPEHERLFQQAVWFEKEVVLPASGIGRRPLLLPLPLKTTTKPLVGLHVRDLESDDDGVRARSTLIYRMLQTQPDPALGERNPGPLPPQEMTRPTLASVFPRSVEPLQITDGTEVPPVPDTIGHGWKVADHAIVEGTTNTHPSAWVCDLTVPSGSASLPANPSDHAFARLHVGLWSKTSDYPQLKHAAVTDLTQTDWLQVYPNPLRQITAQNRSIRIGDAWPTAKDNIIWRRFHIFLAGTGSSDAAASYHVETFYRQAAELQLDSISDRVATVLGQLIEGPDVLDGTTELDLVAVAEEGFLALDYVLDGDKDKTGRPQFVVLRKPGSSATIKCTWNESTRRWVC